MKLIRNIILILFLFISSNCAFAGFEDSFHTSNNKSIILSTTENKNDIINFKDDNSVFEVIKNNQNLTINNKRQSQSSGSNNNIYLLDKQKQNLLKYIYTKAYLDNKQKTALLPLLSQIQPHAP